MFVLVHKGRVQIGPINWNRALFDGNLARLKIVKTLPKVAPEQLPLVIDEDTAIYKAVEQIPEFNQKTHYKEGPYWEITDVATATFLVKEQPLDFVKGALKQEAAAERYNKEVAGTKVTVQSTEVTVDTARGSRDVFVQKFLLMGETDTVTWKFPEAWLTLSKADLQSVVQAGAAHVEVAFAWEAAKVTEIEAATTLAELDAIVIKEPEAQPGQ